jgi:hypothetical protein
MQRNKALFVGMAVVALIALAGCGSLNALLTGQKLTPQARYYDALQTFNRNVTTYNEIYKMSPPEIQAKYKAQIDPAVKATSAALDSWKQFLNLPESVSKEQIWNDSIKNLLALLITSGIIKVE